MPNKFSPSRGLCATADKQDLSATRIFDSRSRKAKSCLALTENKPKVVVVLGTNASGKTTLGVDLANKFKGEIISADSRQVFLGMDLGTGKEGRKAKRHGQPVRLAKGIPQYLVDIKKPTQSFSVAVWQKAAAQLIEDIWSRGKIPLIVGGTGLYLDALTEGFILPKTSTKGKALRKKLEKQSLKQLLNRLKRLDLKTYKRIDKNNQRRIVRALEVCILTNKPFSSQLKRKRPNWDILKIGVTHPRDVLYQRIDQRVDTRIKQGMIAEVKRLKKQGLSWQKLDNFGLEYRFIAQYLQGKITREEMIAQLKYAIHHFAKRQQTWFKRDKDIKWVKNKKQAEKLVKKFLDK